MITKYSLRRTVVSVLFFLISITALSAQNRFSVAIFPVINDTQYPYVEALTSTTEDNIHFMMTQLENYRLIDERNAELASFEINDLRTAAKGKNCDYIIYGVISGQNPFTLSLFLFDRGSNKVIAKRVGTISRMTEIFDVSDKLALALLEDLTGEQITRGELHVVNKGAPGSFIVSVNNRKLDTGITSLLLMKGKYRITIEGINGTKTKTLYSGKFEITEGEQTLVEFKLPVWGKGTLSFTNQGTKPNAAFSVTVDGNGVDQALIGETGSEYLLETGKHKVEVFDSVSGERVFSKNVSVKEGEDTNIPFAINLPEIGKVLLINRGNPGVYDVVLDGTPMGQNLQQIDIGAGSRTIEIFETTDGQRKRVLSKKVTVKNKQTTTVKFKLKGSPTTVTDNTNPKPEKKKTETKKPKRTNQKNSRLNTSLLRYTIGGVFMQSANYGEMNFAQGNIIGGDVGYMKLGYSFSGSSGFGITLGLSLGMAGIWQDLSLYSVDTGSASYSEEIFVGAELGPYFRTRYLGIYPVFTFGVNSGEYKSSAGEDELAQYLFGLTLGFDIFISKSFPICLEVGVAGGWSENDVTGESFEISALTVGIGLGIDF